MPYDIQESDQCPSSEPWAVIKSDTGEVIACHVSQEAAEEQVQALMANENANRLPRGGVERRYVTTADLRAKGAGLRVAGHAAVFNQLSEELWGFREEIAPGAFADTITRADVRALWNHDPNFPLARTKNGTLRLSEDDVGLAAEADFPDTMLGRDFFRQIERGDVDQMSFGFNVLPGGDKWRMENGGLIRTLTKVELFDVSPVTFPAYPQTDISVRSLAQAKLRELLNEPRNEAERERFQARMKARAEFLAQRIPKADPLSFHEIIKKARIGGR